MLCDLFILWAFRDITCRTNLFPSVLLPSGYSWSLWKMAPWPRSVDKAEEAGGLLAGSEICARLAQETTLVIEG